MHGSVSCEAEHVLAALCDTLACTVRGLQAVTLQDLGLHGRWLGMGPDQGPRVTST